MMDARKEEVRPSSQKRMAIVLVTIVCVLVLVFLGARYGIEKLRVVPNNDIVYNNFVFTNAGGVWWTDWQHNGLLYKISLRYSPLDVDTVPVIGSLNVSVFNNRSIYVVFDPNSKSNFEYVGLAAGELGLNLARGMGRNPVVACTTNQTEEEGCKDKPPVNCQNTKGVIMLDNTGEALVSLNNDCVLLRGDGLELLRAVDRLLYTWYGIMQ